MEGQAELWKHQLHPALLGEVTSRLRAIDPLVGTVLDSEDARFTAAETEGLMVAAFLIGFAAVNDPDFLDVAVLATGAG